MLCRNEGTLAHGSKLGLIAGPAAVNCVSSYLGQQMAMQERADERFSRFGSRMSRCCVVASDKRQ